MQTWCAQPSFPVLPQNMQMKGSGPLHCAAVMHRCAAACAGAPTSALTAMAAANNSEVFDKVLIMVSPSDLHVVFIVSGLPSLAPEIAPSAVSRDQRLQVNEFQMCGCKNPHR